MPPLANIASGGCGPRNPQSFLIATPYTSAERKCGMNNEK